MVASCVSTASPVPVTKSFTTEGKLSTPGSRNSLEKNMQEMQMVQQETQQLVQSVEEFALAVGLGGGESAATRPRRALRVARRQSAERRSLFHC